MRLIIRLGVFVAVFVVFLVLGLVPQQHIPQRLTPFIAAHSQFTGEIVRLAAPASRKPDVAITMRIQMDEGVCRVTRDDGQGLKLWFTMGEGSLHHRIPAGSTLVLDPQGNTGSYEVMMGPPWHPLAPKARRFIFLPAAIAMMLSLIFTKRLRSLTQNLGTKRFLFLIALGVVSGVILYPVAHEGGHLIFGMLFGADVNWDGVVWTNVFGEEPRASFSHLPDSARPWMTAGGPIVPTALALLLLFVWRCVSPRVSWYVRAGLVIIPVLFLFSAVGCLFELYGNTHMDALSVHFGLSGALRVMFSLSPLLLTIATYVWLWVRFRRSRACSPTALQET